MFLMGMAMPVVAQNLIEGSLKEIARVGRVKFIADFSDALIHGMTVEDFAIYEKDWYKDLGQIEGDFLEEVNNKAGEWCAVSPHAKSPYTMVWKVQGINRGGDTTSELIFINEQNEIIARTNLIGARGGTFGTKLNLIKDGAEHSGERWGRFLKNEIKRSLREY